MNTKLLTTLALVSTLFITTPSYAGEKEPDKQNVKTTMSVISPNDAASGLPTGKRQYKPFAVKSGIDKSSPLFTNNSSVVPSVSTRTHGLPTGKRQHTPARDNDKSLPSLSKSAYKKCPDGSMINPGETCPEKAVRAGYRLCPDGTMIHPGEKCPEKSVRQFQQK